MNTAPVIKSLGNIVVVSIASSYPILSYSGIQGEEDELRLLFSEKPQARNH